MRDALEEHFGQEGLNAIKEAQESITAKAGQVRPSSCLCMVGVADGWLRARARIVGALSRVPLYSSARARLCALILI